MLIEGRAAVKIIFIINTPAQAHTWKHVITKLLALGRQIKIIARDYDATPTILSECGFKFETFRTVGSRYTRLLGALKHFDDCTRLSRDYSPSLIVGFGADAAVTAARLRVPSVVFIDDDHTTFQNRVTSWLGSTIITPFCFQGALGRKHIRVKGFKELAYLHPDYFKPDVSIFDEMNLVRGEHYFVLRFGSWDAVHDINSQGFSVAEKHQLVKELSTIARVFISPEGPLPSELEPFRLPAPYQRFHHVLYYARMFVCDTGTAASEAAILGTPALSYGSEAMKVGNFMSLNEYGLLYMYENSQQAIAKAVALACQPGIKEEWAEKSRKLLSETIDVCRFLTDFINNISPGQNRSRIQAEV